MIFRKIDTTLPVCHDKRLVAERSREMVLGRRFGLDLQTRFPYPQGIIDVLVYSGEAKMKSHESHVRKHEATHDESSVTDADVEAWSARVREQRKAWLDGPTAEEKKEWAERERYRRARRPDYHHDYEDDEAEGHRIADRFRRDVELVLTGLAGRVIEPPYALIGTLAREGRRFEDELYSVRRHRRRVLADDEI
jgi:hypothetical protein